MNALSSVVYVDSVASVQSVKRRGICSDPKRNSMSEGIRAVDLVLEEWGRWMKGANNILGWRRYSMIGKMSKERDGASQATAPTVIPDGVMETDAAVAKLRDICRKVMVIAYIHHPNAPSDYQRRQLRMSKNKWHYLLGEGRKFVALQLGIGID